MRRTKAARAALICATAATFMGTGMKLAKAISAAALALALTAIGAQSAAAQDFNRAQVRDAVTELATLMEESYVFPEVAQRYGATLRQRLNAGAYDTLTSPAALGQQLTTDLNAVSSDRHLRVSESQGPLPQGRVRMAAGEQAFSDDRWIADGVAYFRINVLPAGEEARAQMAALLDRYARANTLILDLRTCRGGTLDAMDVLFSRLYAQPTELLFMDTRTGANPNLEATFNGASWLRRASNPPTGVTRWVHWAEPAPNSDLADARVFLLTHRTGSACEHLSLAMKRTGRATLVGATTGGAGHYGGERVFADGRMQVWLPIGRTYDPQTNQGWEGTGVTPHRVTAPEDALNSVLREIGVAEVADVAPTRPAAQVVEGAPPTRRYGIMMQPPSPRQSEIAVEGTAPNSIASAAGVRAGDRIVAMNGAALSEIADIGPFMRSSPLTLTVQRGDERVTIRMSLD